MSEQPPELPLYAVGRHRLHQVGIEARGAAPVAILGIVPAPHGDEPNALAELASERLGQRPARHGRHVQIDDDGSGDAGDRGRETGVAIMDSTS